MLSPSDEAGRELVVTSPQRVVVTHAQTPRDSAVQHCLENSDLQHLDLELEGSARSVAQAIRPEGTSGVTYAPVDFDRQVSIMVDVSQAKRNTPLLIFSLLQTM